MPAAPPATASTPRARQQRAPDGHGRRGWHNRPGERPVDVVRPRRTARRRGGPGPRGRGRGGRRRSRRGGRRGRPSASTSARRAEDAGCASPTTSPPSRAATAAGAGRSRWPAAATTARSRSARSCCCPAPTRWSRPPGCRGTSGSAPATSASATCCPPPDDDERLVPGYARVRRPGRRGGRASRSASAASGCCRASAARTPPQRWHDGAARARRRHGARRPGPLRHLRVLPAARRVAARRVRRLRQRVRPGRRRGRRGRVRLRRALRRRRPSRCRRWPSPSSSTTTASTWSRGRTPAGRTLTRRHRPVRHRRAAGGGPRRRGRPRRPGSARTRTPRRTCASAATPTPGSSSWPRTPPTRPGRPGCPAGSVAVARRPAASCGSPTPAPRWTRPGSRRWRRCGRRPSATTPGSVGRFGVGFAAVLAVSRRAADRLEPTRRRCAFSAARTAAGGGRAARPGRRAGPPRRAARCCGWSGRSTDDERAGPAGYDTEVRLPLRPGVDGAALLAHARAAAADLLLALPDLVEIEVAGRRPCAATAAPAPGEVVRSASGAGGWPAARPLGRRDARHRPPSSAPRRDWSAAGRCRSTAAGAPDRSPTTSCTRPTATAERLGLPARLIATVPLEPDRRRVRPGPATDAVLAGAVAALPRPGRAPPRPQRPGRAGARAPGSRAPSSTAGCATGWSTRCAATALAARRGRRRAGARPRAEWLGPPRRRRPSLRAPLAERRRSTGSLGRRRRPPPAGAGRRAGSAPPSW